MCQQGGFWHFQALRHHHNKPNTSHLPFHGDFATGCQPAFSKGHGIVVYATSFYYLFSSVLFSIIFLLACYRRKPMTIRADLRLRSRRKFQWRRIALCDCQVAPPSYQCTSLTIIFGSLPQRNSPNQGEPPGSQQSNNDASFPCLPGVFLDVEKGRILAPICSI